MEMPRLAEPLPKQFFPLWICPGCGREPKRGTWNGMSICCHQFPVLCATPEQVQRVRRAALLANRVEA